MKDEGKAKCLHFILHPSAFILPNTRSLTRAVLYAPRARGLTSSLLPQQLPHRRVQLRVATRVALADGTRDRHVDGAQAGLHVNTSGGLDAHEGESEDRPVEERDARCVDDPARGRLAHDLAEVPAAVAFGKVFGVGER